MAYVLALAIKSSQVELHDRLGNGYGYLDHSRRPTPKLASLRLSIDI